MLLFIVNLKLQSSAAFNDHNLKTTKYFQIFNSLAHKINSVYKRINNDCKSWKSRSMKMSPNVIFCVWVNKGYERVILSVG